MVLLVALVSGFSEGRAFVLLFFAGGDLGRCNILVLQRYLEVPFSVSTAHLCPGRCGWLVHEWLDVGRLELLFLVGPVLVTNALV